MYICATRIPTCLFFSTDVVDDYGHGKMVVEKFGISGSVIEVIAQYKARAELGTWYG